MVLFLMRASRRLLPASRLACALIFAARSQSPAAAPANAASATVPPANDDGRLSEAQLRQLYARTLQLMEAGGVFVPDLTRAGRPLIESERATLESLRFLGFRNPTLHYRWLATLRAYMLLADTLPKPVPFPEESRKQLAELRDILARTEVCFQLQLDDAQRALREPDRDQLRRYADDNLKLPAPAPGKPRVVFLGDSITDWWPLNEYFPNRDFINRGIAGQITGQMLGRFLNDVVALRPSAVLILAGTNDIARGVDIVTAESNLTAMCDLADHYHIKVILATLLPVHDYNAAQNPAYEQSMWRTPQVIRALKDWSSAFAHKRNYTLLNYYQSLLDARAMLARDYSNDGLHPNSAGYRIMAPLALKAIDDTVGAGKAQPAQRRRRLF
jgi:lysophospholipase L1-like esterase